jgi:hypothetical protein
MKNNFLISFPATEKIYIIRFGAVMSDFLAGFEWKSSPLMNFYRSTSSTTEKEDAHVLRIGRQGSTYSGSYVTLFHRNAALRNTTEDISPKLTLRMLYTIIYLGEGKREKKSRSNKKKSGKFTNTSKRG